MKYIRFLIFLLVFSACNKDNLLIEEVKLPPLIELDSETGIYTIKVGRELTISPTYQYAEDALFAWTIEGKLVGSEQKFSYIWEQEGEVYIKIRVDNRYGFSEEELKVEVNDLTPPVISLLLPSKGLKVLQNTDYTFEPDIRHDDLENFNIEWKLNNKVVCTEKTYLFNQKEPGIYPLTIHASNIDGSTTTEIAIEVVDVMPYVAEFPTPSYFQSSTDRYTFTGRPVYLRPWLEYFDHPVFEWSVDGEIVEGETGRMYKFTPTQSGEYMVSVTVSESNAADENVTRHITRSKGSITTEVKVICVKESEEERYRAANPGSSGLWNRVYEYTPGPGQFINETTAIGGMTGNETTPQQAIEWATQRLEQKQHVSLGSFGGYIIVGFDHSIPNTSNEYDFCIQGNAFDGSSEPGIVWVMQDTNGDGLPNDEWFELKGSETGKEETIQDFEVTYFRPAAPRMNVQWVSSEGKSGWIDYNSYHLQDYYYPLWIEEDSYRLTGTCLAARNVQSPASGFWDNKPYDWGYADNYGKDQIAGGSSVDGTGQRNGFNLSHAIYPDGTKADLKYIDFIKVQCGVLAKSGWLGEVSTEVFSFQDLSLTNNN